MNNEYQSIEFSILKKIKMLHDNEITFQELVGSLSKSEEKVLLNDADKITEQSVKYMRSK